MSDTTPSALSGDTVLKSQVRDFICGCESLLSAIEGGTEYLIELYAEAIQQSSASGLFH
jgi:hypothetical protein